MSLFRNSSRFLIGSRGSLWIAFHLHNRHSIILFFSCDVFENMFSFRFHIRTQLSFYFYHRMLLNDGVWS